MLSKELVSDNIPVVTGSDTIGQVIAKMAEFRTALLPVMDQGEYLGLLSEKDIIEMTDLDQLIDIRSIHLLVVSVFESQHIYEVIDLLSRYELTLLPVLTPEKKYEGCITLQSLVKQFSTMTSAGLPGAIFELSFSVLDYSPTMLSRIIEDNNAKIISLLAFTNPDSRNLTVTIKVNTEETSSIMRSFDRYGYTVNASFLTNSQLDDFYRSRYEEFMKYMNI